jgi:isopentenyl-diphosphate Delta-isomerase
MEAISRRKLRHIDACLELPVEYQTRTSGFERYDPPFDALPATDLNRIDTPTVFLGKHPHAPVVIGAISRWLRAFRHHQPEPRGGGTGPRDRVNARLAADHHRRRSAGGELCNPRAHPGLPAYWEPRRAQLNKGHGEAHVRRAIELVGVGSLALHTNPLQEALQRNGDGDFTALVDKIVKLTGRGALSVEPQGGWTRSVGHRRDEAPRLRAGRIGRRGRWWYVVGQGRTVCAVRRNQAARRRRVGYPDGGGADRGSCGGTANTAHRFRRDPYRLRGSQAIALGASMVAVARPLLRPALESVESVTASLAGFHRRTPDRDALLR